MNPLYENDHSRLLQKLSYDADAQAAKATAYSNKLSDAKRAVADAETTFFNDLTDEAALELASAQRRVVDLTVVAAAVENGGGAEYVRERHLQRPGVFSVFSQGFRDRAFAIEKLPAPALKRLAQRRAQLTEAGLPFELIEADPFTAALRNHHKSIAPALASAVFGKTYSDDRGQNREPMSFADLYSALTTPLPQPPPEPAV